MTANQVPASQEVEKAVQSTSSDKPSLTSEEIRKIVTEEVAHSIQQTLPTLLKEAFQTHSTQSKPLEEKGDPEEDEASSVNNRLNKYYTQTKQVVLSEEVSTFLTTAFTKRLSKEVWSDIMQKYPPIKGMESVLIAPTMEAGTKEYIKQKFGFYKTKEVFSTDDGLVERQTPFLAVARPIAAALERLEEPPNAEEGEEAGGPDPDEIKSYLVAKVMPIFVLMHGDKSDLLNT